MASLTPPVSRPVVLYAVQTLDAVLAELTATSHDDAVERVADVRRKLAGELWGYPTTCPHCGHPITGSDNTGVHPDGRTMHLACLAALTEPDVRDDASRPEPGPMEAPDLAMARDRGQAADAFTKREFDLGVL